jgi:hypothetical protein
LKDRVFGSATRNRGPDHCDPKRFVGAYDPAGIVLSSATIADEKREGSAKLEQHVMYTKYNLLVKKKPRPLLSLKTNLTADDLGAICDRLFQAGLEKTVRTNIFNDFIEDRQLSQMYREDPFGRHRLRSRPR